ncbi:hypothetical protein GmHk_01G000166 [Glycine max]|nr:hypothetical protein GmHk_01G000166 [Glycine max]
MTLFFVEASIHNIICFKATMRSFELVSWLKVNFHKSWLGDFGMDSHLVHRYAHLLCPCLSNTLGFLLGLIIGGSVYGKVSWISVGIGLDEVCRPRELKGLGIKNNIKHFNIVLLRKWRWRMMAKRKSLWCLVLKSKYENLDDMSFRRVSHLNFIL